ncbi:peptidase S8/S53 domain-containing protein [Podospora aff. communis PSN243]|uniref:Peptidase S8/S53 domain-containing protein n=1 Tax=Podospora aff. communis PSN243 TaxID=3040156 RepID=A0AAV9GVP7_9PEZI|nr:peptidase S8/S53 domain-containing protein [Podospora aff. communis PSN243]
MVTSVVRSTKALATGLLCLLISVGPAAAASIPRQAQAGDVATQPVIAIKLNPEVSSTRKRQDGSLAGADLVKSLVLDALPSNPIESRQNAPDLNVLPLFNLPSDVIDKVIADAEANSPGYKAPDFRAWFQVALPDPDTEVESVLRTLNTYPEVASCQSLASFPAPQLAVDPSDDELFPQQGYLKASPEGIDAEYAWGRPGGDGSGQRVIDIESGWKLDHEDLIAANIELLPGSDNNRGGGFADWRHGTAVLGIMLMVDNDLGGVGAAPGAHGDVVSIRRNGIPADNRPEAIMDATSRLSAGDVMLLELQVSNAANETGFLTEYWPVELYDAELEAIKLATAKGIVVIEPAGNGLIQTPGEGDVNLDGPVIRPGETEAKEWMNPSSPDYRGDSGAIIVGASTSTVPRSKTIWSNYGSRVDVHAWGENVLTTMCRDESPNCVDNYEAFDGTSAASPIIVGAALSVQGMLVANGRSKLNSFQMRELLKMEGAPVTNPEAGNIGVMPNLRALIDGGHVN